MTVRETQKVLVDDLNELFRNDYFKTPEVTTEDEWPDWVKDSPTPVPDWHLHRMAAPKAYDQFLPLKELENGSIDPEAEDPFPYIIVRADQGGTESPTDPHKANFILIIGIFDDDPQNKGHRAVLEIIERIQMHYLETPNLKGIAVCDDPFDWVMQEEESYPYFFGACKLVFNLQAPRVKRSDLT